MAHVEHRLGRFTGQVGPVRFTNGHAETEDTDMVAYFRDQPDLYDVTEDEQPEPGEDGGPDEAIRNKRRRVARDGDGAE